MLAIRIKEDGLEQECWLNTQNVIGVYVDDKATHYRIAVEVVGGEVFYIDQVYKTSEEARKGCINISMGLNVVKTI